MEKHLPLRDIVIGRAYHELSPINKKKVSTFELDEYFNCAEDDYYNSSSF